MNRNAQVFAPLSVPLSGTNLIEASAGTGKTWGIAALFARLVLKEQMAVDRILVVTFTRAATAELKGRLRARLEEALRCLEAADGAAETDELMAELLEQAVAEQGREQLRLRVKAALSQFDNAAIYTIHGFCQRVLRDYAFLCQVPFDLRFDEQSRDHLLPALEDFWRKTVAADAVLAELAVKYGQTPAQVLEMMSPYLARPQLVFRRPETDLAAARQQAADAWWQVAENLAEREQAFWQLHGSVLNSNTYRRTTFGSLFAELSAAAAEGHLPQMEAKILSKLPLLSAEALAQNCKKGKQADPAWCALLQPLADWGGALAGVDAAEQETLAALQLDALIVLRQAAEEYKQRRQQRGFDDLLLDVYQALVHGTHREQLARALADTWQFALIDEFQDTDPLQYEIFRRSFADCGRPLFLVGDPKQAIYRFRGADIYAYLQAARDAQHHYTLDTNRRSHRELIDGISHLFGRKQSPFVLADIDYPPVHAAREQGRLNDGGEAVQIRWLNEGGGEAENKEVLRSRAAEYCTAEIAAVLQQAAAGRLKLAERPVQPGDVAVLVRTHNEAELVSRTLKQQGIRSVLIRRDSVFTSAEAEAVASLLAFWLEPRRSDTLRFVLAGVLFAYTAAELDALNRNEAELAAHLSAAERALSVWRQNGIFAALQQFAGEYGLESRLLAAHNERTLTNFWQLAELLAVEDELSRTPAALLHWLQRQMQGSEIGGENNTLRLESDEELVKIVTMHAAKGLQYPLVYCPFVWDATAGKPAEWQILHRPTQAAELLGRCQLSGEDEEQVADEELGERLRLLYVALTRAEERLVLYAAHCQDSPYNTFAYLLEGRPEDGRQVSEAAYKSVSGAEQAEMLKANWLRLISQAPAGCRYGWQEGAPPPAAAPAARPPEVPYKALQLPERRFEWIRHTSFTGLTRNLGHQQPEEELLPQMDAAETAASTEDMADGAEENEYGIGRFPRGAQTGLCWHELLEHIDFQKTVAEQGSLIDETLTRYGWTDQWRPALATMLEQTLNTPLDGSTALKDLPPQERLAEMGFMMHMADFGLGRLKTAWAQSGLSPVCITAAEHLDFSVLHGFLNGFIDLTCRLSDGQWCVIDYKSNHLGNQVSAYHAQALDEAVAGHHYYLQAWIYAVAVARYARQRHQPLHTVQIRYLFLRGVDGQGGGVWSWDIPVSLLESWL